MSPRAERHPSSVSEGGSPEIGSQRVLADAAKPKSTVVFDPARHCGAETNRVWNGGTPCRQAKGWHTDHPGTGNCRFHGGMSPNGKKYAATQAAERALERLGIPVETNPEQALLEVVWEAAGNVAFLRAQCSALGLDLTLRVSEVAQRASSVSLEDGEGAEIAEATGHAITVREDVRAIVKLYGEWTDRLAKYAKAAVDAGIAKRQVELAEATADAIVGVINAVFDELALDDVQRERGRTVAGARLRLLAGGRAA